MLLKLGSPSLIVRFVSCFTHDVIIGVLDCSDRQHGYQRDECGVEGNRGHARDELQVARERGRGGRRRGGGREEMRGGRRGRGGAGEGRSDDTQCSNPSSHYNIVDGG